MQSSVATQLHLPHLRYLSPKLYTPGANSYYLHSPNKAKITIGTLTATVLPDDRSGKTVSGYVLLQHQTRGRKANTTTDELYGPLQITVTLHGRSKTKITEGSGPHESVYRGRVSLVSESSCIHNGPLSWNRVDATTYLFP